MDDSQGIDQMSDEQLKQTVYNRLMLKSLSSLKSDIRKLRAINSNDALEAITIIKHVIAIKKGTIEKAS